MIRRSPCEFYLKYLIVHPSNHGNDKIHELCKRQQLDSLDDDYLEYLRSQLIKPDPFLPNDKLHQKSQAFLVREKIQKLFLRSEEMRRAVELLDSARAKEFVESMSLSGASTDLITSALGPHRGFRCSVVTVELYLHFFWNINLLDTTEIRALLQMRAPDEDQAPSNKKAMAKAYHKAFKDDPRVVAANLPNSPITAMISQMRMGFMPRTIDLAMLLQYGKGIAMARAVEAVQIGGAFDSKKALDYSLAAKTMAEMLETVVKPDEKLREELSTIALQTETSKVPLIHELSAGEHTVELAPRALSNEPSTGPRKTGIPNPADGNPDQR